MTLIATLKHLVTTLAWKDWQDTFIFWICAPLVLILLYGMVA